MSKGIAAWSWMVVGLLALSGCAASEGDEEIGEDEEALAEDEEVAQSEEALSSAKFRCAGYEQSDCVCTASPFNCQLPNSQPGRNRFLTLSGDINWSLEDKTPFFDGLGNLRGDVTASKTMVNYGQRKQLNGQKMVYAFATRITGGIAASGWIPEDKLSSAPLERMPTVRARNPGQGDYATKYTLKGGVPEKYKGLKVNTQNVSREAIADDYLERPGGYINLIYNLPGSGGVSADTFPVGTPFRRSRGVKMLSIRLYTKANRPVGSMGFVYGHVGDRYGWVAQAALTKS